jgi:hypothetical protein
VKLYRC